MSIIKHRKINVNGINFHIAEAGKGPLVIMLHGFPELWFSWRNQLTALAEAGYHAVAPDLRGFGESEATPKTRDYSLFQHAKDVKGIIDYMGEKEATVVGHDWGSNVMWIMPMLYPETVNAVVSLSIPFYPEPRDPEKIKNFSNGKFSFMEYFQKPGAVEAEFEENPERFFRLFFYGFSGDAPADTVKNLFLNKPEDAKLLDDFPEPDKLPPWLTEDDLEYYVNAFKTTGITWALNFYRNVDDDYILLKELYKKRIKQPVLFIGGGEEAAVKFGNFDAMKNSLPGLRETIVLPGCGHWVQQERAEEINLALIKFLNREILN